MTGQKRMSEWKRFLLQFHQPLIYILLASSVISAAPMIPLLQPNPYPK